ncbi:hypothetical protein C5613_09550 [Rhodococcus opacus]|uniref:Uncharacterized protein n=1 Tax=Rhodococcus opacus TaxID=37919 RepID=A0A2S8JDK3_RHOOP|nr:hypothetical protein C5613_09550 [Rhodococcus opacus]
MIAAARQLAAHMKEGGQHRFFPACIPRHTEFEPRYRRGEFADHHAIGSQGRCPLAVDHGHSAAGVDGGEQVFGVRLPQNLRWRRAAEDDAVHFVEVSGCLCSRPTDQCLVAQVVALDSVLRRQRVIGGARHHRLGVAQHQYSQVGSVE